MALPELEHWQFFEVKFFVGIPPGEEMPEQREIFKWLAEETPKFVDRIYVRPAALRTQG